ncbi:hypothetical protein IEO70_04800 [Bacillus sp. AGMB 02131]|uniref:Uncharacterized protein n=1 Tax=Peribacillus faecalis TaxID=2772559 RepID=A0A927HBR7_9BACI|nr:hypothetical protein [Peribacillus faecalis]MBD3107678.1 hypothetical protein [Peribacillus faecalis]
MVRGLYQNGIENRGKLLATLSKYNDNTNKQFNNSSTKIYDSNFTTNGKISETKKEQMRKDLTDLKGFIL